MRRPNFYIHYEPASNNSEIDFRQLWNSILGFNTLLKEIHKISSIQWEIELRAVQPRQGSIIIPTVSDFLVNGLPFTSLDALLAFLQTTEPKLYCDATTYFDAVWYSPETQKSFWENVVEGKTSLQVNLNEFAGRRPWEFWAMTVVLSLLFSKFAGWCIEKTRGIKNQSLPDATVPKRYFWKLRRLTHFFRRPLEPIRENEVSRIDFSLDGATLNPTTGITSANLWEFLPDHEELLPELKNWVEYTFQWEVKNFQSSKGDFLKIKIHTKSGKFLVVAKPGEEHTTEEFIQFYKKNVSFRAEVLRESRFQMPKLKIVSTSMTLIQKSLL